MKPFVVRAPATSANLGPGFDCLGLALDLWNEVRVTPADELRVTATGDGPLPPPKDNLILVALRKACEWAGQSIPPVELRCTNRVPLSRGLGSSAAAIVAGVLLARECLGAEWSTSDILDLATSIEGHPDNITPSLLGGVQVSVVGESGQVFHVAVPLKLTLWAAVFIPDGTLSTERARAALPPSVSRADALFNVARASLLVAALAAGEASVLREATRDRLHQPYREPLFPAGMKLVGAAEDAGALGACISGAGPSVLALGGDAQQAQVLADALRVRASHENIPGKALVLPISQRGAYVEPV